MIMLNNCGSILSSPWLRRQLHGWGSSGPDSERSGSRSGCLRRIERHHHGLGGRVKDDPGLGRDSGLHEKVFWIENALCFSLVLKDLSIFRLFSQLLKNHPSKVKS